MKALLAAAVLGLHDQRGAGSVEYGLIVFLIAAAIIVAAAQFGDNATGLFDCTKDSIVQRVSAC